MSRRLSYHSIWVVNNIIAYNYAYSTHMTCKHADTDVHPQKLNRQFKLFYKAKEFQIGFKLHRMTLDKSQNKS